MSMYTTCEESKEAFVEAASLLDAADSIQVVILGNSAKQFVQLSADAVAGDKLRAAAASQAWGSLSTAVQVATGAGMEPKRIQEYARIGVLLEAIPTLVDTSSGEAARKLAPLVTFDKKAVSWTLTADFKAGVVKWLAGLDTTAKSAGLLKRSLKGELPAATTTPPVSETANGSPPPADNPPADIGPAPPTADDAADRMGATVEAFAKNDEKEESAALSRFWDKRKLQLVVALGGMTDPAQSEVCELIGWECGHQGALSAVKGYCDGVRAELNKEGCDSDTRAVHAENVDALVDSVTEYARETLVQGVSESSAATSAVVEVEQEVNDRLAAPEVLGA